MPIPRHSALKHIFEESIASEYSAELFVGGDVLRAGVFFTHWEPLLFHRFTFIGIASLWIWDAQVRRHFQDCHHLQNHTTSNTRLDIPTAHRHDALRTKQVIIGCGGGFRHECASKYSPVAQWMSEVDLALQDESQQYGNLDETAAIARLPRNCIVLWLGDHRQTLGGLRKSIVARRFRQKLLRRPVALRGNSEKVQPNTLYKVVARYLTGTPLSPAYPMIQLMKPDPLSTQGARDQVEVLTGELLGTYSPWLAEIVLRIALTVLWLAMHRHEVDSMVALGLVEVAGLSGRRNWALILSSSARVSRVTVIAVRYPELDAVTPTHVTFGNYLADCQATVGGFLAIFWRFPHNVIHAIVDLGHGWVDFKSAPSWSGRKWLRSCTSQ